MSILFRLRRGALPLLLLAAAASQAAGQRAPHPTTVVKDGPGPRLDELVPRLMREGDVPGVSVAVVRDGSVVWHRAFGVKDAGTGAPVDDNTIFEAASLSKPVFAYAVMKLADAGRLDLDAPLTKYLPGDY